MKDIDLSLLGRESATGQQARNSKTNVPPPRFHWKTRVALPGLILLAAGAVLFVTAADVLMPRTPVRVVPVLTKADTGVGAVGSVVVQAPGWVEADPYPTAVSALTDGIVEEVLVLEGDRIERGQIVAQLVADDARLASSMAKAALAEREAALVAVRAVLDEAQRNWDHPIELTRRLETARARLNQQRAELARWPSELAREQAQLVYLTAEYERVAPLLENEQASNIEVTRARQAFEAQKAEAEAMRRRKPILEAQVAVLAAEVQAASENLTLRIADTRALAEAKAAVQGAEATVAFAQARRDEAALRLRRMEVRSPSAGIVMTRLVEPGSKLILSMDNPRSAQVVRLYDPEKLQVRVDIPLVEAAKVGVGQPAEVIVDVLPNRVFRGRLTRVVHEADVQKNTLQVKVAIENPSAEIKPEMLARARFLSTSGADAAGTGSATALLLVPRRAVFEAEGRSFVWLADQVDKVARRVAVKRGRVTLDDWCSVAEGLQMGDRIIVNAPPDLEDGQRIRMLED